MTVHQAGFAIRDASVSDAPALLVFLDQLAHEKDIDIPLAPGEVKMTVEQEEAWVRDHVERDNSLLKLAIVAASSEHDGGELIGVLNITGRTQTALHHTAVLGLSVRRDWRGRGVGNALLAAATAEVAAVGVLKRVELRVYTTNLPALHLYEKYGFQREGCARRAVFQRGRYYDDYVMGWLVSGGDDMEARS